MKYIVLFFFLRGDRCNSFKGLGILEVKVARNLSYKWVNCDVICMKIDINSVLKIFT